MSPRRLAEKTFSFTAANVAGDLLSTLTDMSNGPMTHHALQVKATGFTAWTLLLEGTLNGTDWETLVTHTNVTPGDGKIIWTTTPKVAKKTRMSLTAVTGSGTIAAHYLGVRDL